MGTSICIECGEEFEFSDGCSEGDDGDMCKPCTDEWNENLADELTGELEEVPDAH
jgi:uncharacterized Zn ribbon protein